MTSIVTGVSLVVTAAHIYGDFTPLQYARLLGFDLKDARLLEQGVAIRISERKLARANKLKVREQRPERLRKVDDLAACIFGTYELLEMVILHLRVRDMVRLRRVSQAFNTIIIRSHRIRRALFLEPSPQQYAPFSLNPCCQLRHLQLGPWKLTRYRHRFDAGKPGSTCVMHFDLCDDFYSRAKPLAMVDTPFAHGSWKDMLLGRPACDRVRIKLYVKSKRRLISRTTADSCQITMGNVQEILRDAYTRTVGSEDWRSYADHKQTFKQNVHAIKP